ncbi:MAG: 30S ribosomal protein S3 [Clostridia bacterium]|nr:30S ribosomal protein S3 [Clostridia bacterium]
MGQKVNPHGYRVGITMPWSTQWYAEGPEFAKLIKEDYDIRTFLKKNYFDSAISSITIVRAANKVEIGIYTGRPGQLIGKGGAEIDVIKKNLAKITNGKVIIVNVKKIDKVDQDAQLVAEAVAAQLEKRVSYRRAMKAQLSKVVKSGVKGVKIMVKGRLDGREISGKESYHEGSIPLQTIRADIDYGFAEAHTTFGVLGVKCWIYKGEILQRSGKKLMISDGGEE